MIEMGEPILFAENLETGLIPRVTGDSMQVVIPQSLKTRVLSLCHDPVVSAHPGGRKMYKTLRHTCYWPYLALDCYNYVRNCPECAKERVRIRKKSATMKLFPAKAPLQDVAMDLLGPLLKTKRGNKHLLVITDRFTKLVKVVPLRSSKGLTVAQAFVDNWVFNLGPPKTILTDNGSQFRSKFMLEVHRALGIKTAFTTAYRPQTNGQTERYNRTIISALRKYVAEHPKSWDLYVNGITFAYNCAVHETTQTSPFSLVLSEAPGLLSIEQSPREYRSVEEMKLEWLGSLEKAVAKAQTAMSRRQERYRKAFDKRVRHIKPIQKGDFVYLQVGSKTSSKRQGEKARTHKLAQKALGPYVVVKVSDKNTATISDGLKTENVHVSRLEFTSPTETDRDRLMKQELIKEVLRETSDSNETSEQSESPRDQIEARYEYIVDKIESHKLTQKRKGEYLYRVKWFGFKERTWEPIQHLHKSQIRRYHRQAKIDLPSNFALARND